MKILAANFKMNLTLNKHTTPNIDNSQVYFEKYLNCGVNIISTNKTKIINSFILLIFLF